MVFLKLDILFSSVPSVYTIYATLVKNGGLGSGPPLAFDLQDHSLFWIILTFIPNPFQNVPTGILVQAKMLWVTLTKFVQMNANPERTANSLVSKAALATGLKGLGLYSTL